MKPCEMRDGYLDAGLGPGEKAAFEKHLSLCRDCCDWVNEWRMFERGVTRWVKSRQAPPVTVKEAARLVQRAEIARGRREEGRIGRHIGIVMGFAATAAIAVAMVLVITGEPNDESERNGPVDGARAVVSGLGETEVSLPAGEELVAPAARSVTAVIQKDTVALSSKGRLRLIRLARGKVRLGLEAGTVACRVDKRQAGDDFVVEAGAYSVTVVGTRFSVTKAAGGIDVVVQEGKVRVERQDGERWVLNAGDALSGAAGQPTVKRADAQSLRQVDALFLPATNTESFVTSSVATEDLRPSEPVPDVASIPSAPALDETEGSLDTTRNLEAALTAGAKQKRGRETKVADLPGWRRAVVDGRGDEASREMRAYLKNAPDDTRVLALYADAARKRQAWSEAVRAYKKVIELGEAAEASRAMYMLGSIYQSPLGRHAKALAMFRAYKKSGHVSQELGELTDVKIAKSLVAEGKCAAARQEVAYLLSQSGSFVAENARKMVDACEASTDK